ncbi:MAG: NAD-dependent protein deacylase, partial [Elusimicrobia bacterium]|nr:NAD-dependent protein deacylase [Elusimicrobiota bacterium]
MTQDDALAAAARRLAAARSAAVLTGAGVSAESGVPTFRGPDGAWRGLRSSDLATPGAFSEDPRLVWEWYDWRRGLVAAAAPNAAHRALAALEARLPSFSLATQNVDGLHARAGSRAVLELHGSLWTLRCCACGRETEDRRTPLPGLPPRCPCGGILRPGVVWFGEGLPQEVFAAAASAARSAEVYLVVGTAGAVEPAASLARLARKAGAFVAEVNPDLTALT